MLTTLLSLALAASPREGCDTGDAPSCLQLVDETLARLGDTATPEGTLDPRYLPALEHFAVRACAAGSPAACTWTTGGTAPEALCTRHPEASVCPVEPAPVTLTPGVPVPLPGGGWTSLHEGELGGTGRWIPGAGQAILVEDTLFLTDGNGALVLEGDAVRVMAPVAACDVQWSAYERVSLHAANCYGPRESRSIDLATGNLRRAPMTEKERTDRQEAVHRVRLAARTGAGVDFGRGPFPPGIAFAADAASWVPLERPRDTEWSPDGTLVLKGDRLVLLAHDTGAVRAGWTVPKAAWRLEPHPLGGSVAVITPDGHAILPFGPMPEGGIPPVLMGPLPDLLRPPDPDGEAWMVVDATGAPVANAWVGGRLSDTTGAIDRFFPRYSDPVFVDRLPRAFTTDSETRQIRILPSTTVVLPPGADPASFVAEGWSERDVLEDRAGPNTYVTAESVGGAQLCADRPRSKDGKTDFAGAARIWGRRGDEAWTPLRRQAVQVEDEAGYPLAGITLAVGGDGWGYETTTDSLGKALVWEAPTRNTLVPVDPTAYTEDFSAHLPLPFRIDADRLIVTGAASSPGPWRPPKTPLHGAWHGVDQGRPLTQWLFPHRVDAPSLPGMGSQGFSHWIAIDDGLYDVPEAYRLYRRTPRPKNNKRWFTGVPGLRPGDVVTERIDLPAGVPSHPWRPSVTVTRYTGRPERMIATSDRPRHVPMLFENGIPAGAVDPDEKLEIVLDQGIPSPSVWEQEREVLRDWAMSGGPLANVQLERGVPHPENVLYGDERIAFIWTYEGLEDCGGTRCARIRQSIDATDMVLFVDPRTMLTLRMELSERGKDLVVERTLSRERPR